jgi:uncharacterized membrane protein
MKFTGNYFVDIEKLEKRESRVMATNFLIMVGCLIICSIIGIWFKDIYFMVIIFGIFQIIGVIAGLIALFSFPYYLHQHTKLMGD